MITGPEPRRPGERRTTCGWRDISLQPVRANKAADAAEIERAFAAVRAQFSLHVAGYPSHRPRRAGSAGEGAPA